MENPNSSDGSRSVLAMGSILGNNGGRPPDVTVHMEDDMVLERSGSPVDGNDQLAWKKGRNCEGSSKFLMQSASMHSAERGVALESNSHSGGQEQGLSFRDTLMGGIGRIESDALVEDLDVEVQEEDVIIRKDGDLPEIRFSDRVVNRRRTNGRYMNPLGSVTRPRASEKAGGSRFMVLAEDGIEPNGEADDGRGGTTDPIQTSPIHVEIRVENREGEAQRVMVAVSPRRSAPKSDDIRLGRDLRNSGPLDGTDQGDQTKVAAQGSVRHGKSSLNSMQHTAVTVDESATVRGPRNVTGRVLPASIRGGSSLVSVKKGADLPLGQKGSLKPRKKDARGPSSSTLAASLAPLVAKLESAGKGVVDGRGYGLSTEHSPALWRKRQEGVDDDKSGLGKGPVSSRFWKGLAWASKEVRECLSWSIRNGLNTDFWYDSWLGRKNRLASDCLLEMAPRPLMVADMVSASGDWDWARDWQLTISQIPRACNVCADRLAALGRGQFEEVVEFEVPPTELIDLVVEEAAASG
ncbi:hypothetical protein V6N11_031558 [Hibiscus sabdariffa]|uniref:Uncharacterized protein n=1 Tax=Hibiscus sabdariffa TaxID=183260 RepID=A0ABR2SYU2_9ROSI